MNNEIVIEIEGGVIHTVNIPKHLKDVVIIIKDYDVEGIEEDRLETDGDDKEFIKSIYESE